MQYRCTRCGELHEGVPALSAAAPLYYYAVPQAERDRRCRLDDETCVVDDDAYFARGCLEIPILGDSAPFSLGLWVSLSQANFERFVALLPQPDRAAEGPYFGWLSAHVEGFADCDNLKTLLHLRDHGFRPLIELEPTDHPLAIAQRQGISRQRVGEILAEYRHGKSAG